MDEQFLPLLTNQIVDACKNASELIERIRTFIRPQRPRQEVVDMQPLVHEVWALVRQQARDRHIEINLPIDQRLANVQGDPVQLSQVVLTVFQQAIAAASDAARRHIRVTLAQAGDSVVLTVQNSGSAVPPPLLKPTDHSVAALFSSKFSMSWLIAREIIAQHQGQLHFSNPAEGGAVVEIRLPSMSSMLAAEATT